LDVEMDVPEKEKFQKVETKSKPKVRGLDDAKPCLFEWLTRLHIVIEELKTKMGIEVGDSALIKFPVPKNHLDLS
jgi:hypothetical protein